MNIIKGKGIIRDGSSSLQSLPALDPFKLYDFPLDLSHGELDYIKFLSFFSYGDSLGNAVNVAFQSSNEEYGNSGGYVNFVNETGRVTADIVYDRFTPVSLQANGSLQLFQLTSPTNATLIRNLYLNGDVTDFSPPDFSGYSIVQLTQNTVYDKPIVAVGDRTLPGGGEGLNMFICAFYPKVPSFDLTNFDQIELYDITASEIKLTNCTGSIHLQNAPNVTEQIEIQAGNGPFSALIYINTGITSFVAPESLTYLELTENQHLESIDLTGVNPSGMGSGPTCTIYLHPETSIDMDDLLNSLTPANWSGGYIDLSIIGGEQPDRTPLSPSYAAQLALVAAGCFLNWAPWNE